MTSIEQIREKYPQYSDMSDGDLLMGIHRKHYSDMHPRSFLNSIEGAANAHATIKSPELRQWWQEGVSKPLPGEDQRDTDTRLGGTSYGPANVGGKPVAALRSFTQGITLGYGDEIVGTMAAARDGNSPVFERERERRRVEAGERKYPAQSAVAEVTGALAAPGVAVRSVPAAIAAGTGGGMLYASGKAEPGERIGSAVAAAPESLFFSAAAVPAQRGISAAYRRLTQGAQKRPSIGALKRVRDEAYKAVDDSGFTFSKEQFDDALAEIYKRLDAPDSAYVKGDAKVERALKLVENNWGKDMTLGQLDNVRKRVFKTWASAAPDEAEAILDIVGVIDDMIEASEGAAPILSAAREAHKSYMRSDFLDKAFQKAADNAQVSGSGGNVYNNYARVFKDIVNNPRKARMFDEQQLSFMRNAIESKPDKEALRRLGKLSPEGNGLMLALNIIGGTIDPSLAAMGGVGAAAKAASDRGMARQVDEMLDLASGQKARTPRQTNTRIPTAAAVAGQNY